MLRTVVRPDVRLSIGRLRHGAARAARPRQELRWICAARAGLGGAWFFHGARRVAADCDGATPRREREPLASHPDLATLKRWLRRWVAVRHRDAAERTVLTAIKGGASPAALADLLFAVETDRAYADGGHSL